MSETTSSPSAEPGAAVVSPWPNVTEVPEPGGVNWTMRRPSMGGDVAVEAPTQALIERLGSLDVGHGDDHDLELHVDPPDARVAACVVDVSDAHHYLLICGARRNPELGLRIGDATKRTRWEKHESGPRRKRAIRPVRLPAAGEPSISILR